MYKFAAMILCHGRPENTPTYDTLLQLDNGATGSTYPTMTITDNDNRIVGIKTDKKGKKTDIAGLVSVKFNSNIAVERISPRLENVANLFF